MVKGIHTVAEFEKIGKWIAGCPAYYLQNYEENENCLYRMIQTEECDDVKPDVYKRQAYRRDLCGIDQLCEWY